MASMSIISNKAISPKAKFLIIMGVYLALLLSAIYGRLQIPWTGIDFQLDQTREKIFVADIDPESPNLGRIAVGTYLQAILTEKETVPITPLALTEEPDHLPSWETYLDFIEQQNLIYTEMMTPAFHIQTESGDVATLIANSTTIGKLPWQFWFLSVFAAGSCTLIAGGIWAFQPRMKATNFLLIASFGVVLSALGAAIYSSREIAIGATLYSLSAMINQMGSVVVFSPSLLALLSVYPAKIISLRWALASLILAISSFILILQQSVLDISSLLYGSMLVIYLGILFVCFLQWRGSRHKPDNRAALKWFLLSIIMSTVLFITLITIPVLAFDRPFASQTIVFSCFPLMFAGLALGISRYRLFDLEQWWINAWVWLLGGAAVVAIDLSLMAFLQIDVETSLLITLLVFGWIYFPARQWLLDRVFRYKQQRQMGLSRFVAALTESNNEFDFESKWADSLKAQFDALKSEYSFTTCNRPQLLESGQLLVVPSLDEDGRLEIRYPDQGGRLFRSNDLELATQLYELAKNAYRQLRDKQRAIKNERARIMNDLHDDLGSRLLTLTYDVSEEQRKETVHKAIADMRRVLQSLQRDAAPLTECIAEWKTETETLMQLSSHQLLWKNSIQAENSILSPSEHSHLTRVLRELTTNAIKHSEAGSDIQIDIFQHGNELKIELNNRTSLISETQSTGTLVGMRSIERRVADLNGIISMKKNVNCVNICLQIPLSAQP